MNKLFSGKNLGCHIVEQRLKVFFEENPIKFPKSIANSPRAIGDAVQEILSENLELVLAGYCAEFSSDFARRSMADFAFQDVQGNYCIVDAKTHRLDTKFNMPNLTSVERLSKFYEDDKNYFLLLMMKYEIENLVLSVKDITFVPIEWLDWECLTIGALGWGQIQIANANHLLINQEQSRKQWMLEFCQIMLEFYPREILKINNRVDRFEKVKQFWLQKP